MPPADNQPDFDSMSPEELMAWMETLAERQGATQGFTTDKRMEIGEVDESTVVDEPGYVPYGMDAEKWKAMQEAEKAEKAAAKAAAKPVPPPAPAPVPQPEPVAAAPAMAMDATPDFDSMSPEELMAWMETLAERQGATQGFTTDKRMEIGEVDASTVIDEPGYVPYGMDAEKWKAMQEAEKAEKAAAKAAAKPVPPPAPAPVSVPPPVLEPIEEDIDETEVAEPVTDDAMSWLSSLAADQQPNFEMDLSSLDNELESLTSVTAASDNDPLAWLESLAQGEDDDLAGLAVEEGEDFEDESLAASARVATGKINDPIESGEDPVAWLESLAKRQGVSADEFVTAADLDIPLPEDTFETGPGYSEFAFEDESSLEAMPILEDFIESGDDDFDPSSLDDPEAWLESLATGQGFEAAPEFEADEEEIEASVADEDFEEDVLEALNQGEEISPDMMTAWMNRQFDRAAEIGDEVEEDYDPDAPPVKAEIPDWLLEQMGTPPAIEAEEEEAAPAPVEEVPPAFVSEIAEPALDMPDWLSVDEPEDMSIDSIFASDAVAEPVSEPVKPMTTTEEISMDSDDPWVIAFEQERAEGMVDVNATPEWYAARLEGREIEEEVPAAPAPAAAPAPVPEGAAAGLEPVAFAPEVELAEGEAEPLPDWLSGISEVHELEAVSEDLPDWLKDEVIGGEMPSAEVEAAIFVDETEDLPDWLKETEVEPAEMPDWLKDTLSTDEQEAVSAPPVPAPLPAAPVSPAPVAVAAASIDVAATLQDARSKVSAGDVDSGLIAYETVIRANAELEAVVVDLTRLMNDARHKENPAVYRVLGDGLMRQGKLQMALDTYRKALNLL